jgi:hypothetical protein
MRQTKSWVKLNEIIFCSRNTFHIFLLSETTSKILMHQWINRFFQPKKKIKMMTNRENSKALYNIPMRLRGRCVSFVPVICNVMKNNRHCNNVLKLIIFTSKARFIPFRNSNMLPNLSLQKWYGPRSFQQLRVRAVHIVSFISSLTLKLTVNKAKISFSVLSKKKKYTNFFSCTKSTSKPQNNTIYLMLSTISYPS